MTYIRPMQFLVIRDGEYVPMSKVSLLPGEQVFYYRGQGYKLERCTLPSPMSHLSSPGAI